MLDTQQNAGTSTAAVERIQAYLHTKTVQQTEQVVIPPFTVYLHPSDTSCDANYAMPHAPVIEPLLPILSHVCVVFAARHRTPCFSLLDACAPALATVLPRAGFREVARSQVMVCTQQTLRLPPLPADAAVVTLSSESSLDEIKEGLNVNALGFDPQADRATDAEAAEFRRSLHGSRAFTLWHDGQAVSGGMFTDIRDGVAELVGIATLAPFRRRGLAAALTAYATQTAFEHGANMVFLVAANAPAGRVYARVGFRPCAALLQFRAA
jgi:GNAT superfamily N-acetyltransferase